MILSRRSFFKLAASATMAAVALQVIPVSALPLKGELHDAIFENCLAKARRLWYGFVKEHNLPPHKGHCGIPFFEQLEVDLTAGDRITFIGKSSKEWDAILIKSTPIYPSESEPMWSIRYVARS